MIYQYKEKLVVIEKIKNGYLSSAMYGDYKEIYFEPLHIILLANTIFPRKYMSENRLIVCLYVKQ